MSKEYRVPESVRVVTRAVPVESVRRVVLHDEVTEIAEDSFRDWTGLREVVFGAGSSLKRVGALAFANTALESFVAPRSLKTIQTGALRDCKDLKEVRLNEGLESLGEGVFAGSGLETIYIPSTLREAPKGALFNCKSLRKVLVAEGCKVDVKGCVWFTADVETVAPDAPAAEPDSTPAEDEEALRRMLDEREAQVAEL